MTQTDQKPSTDTRIVYGAGCTYWGDIASVGLKGALRLPSCPHCGGMLYEMPSEAMWLSQVEAYAQETRDPEYVTFIRWTKGRACLSLHPNQDGRSAYTRLRRTFEAERQA